jgi:hypothetical protein
LGDWLLLTIFIIFLIGLALALRNSLPRYLEEVRLLLNIGPVREGERVIYNNLPWRVSRLNIYSDLVNPALTGGRIRIPITELSEMVSRRWSRTEPWFPCKPKDFVILNDETYGEVILQTPDIVQIKVFGGSIKTFKMSDFLDLSPKNLSEGFGVNITLRLDYSLQPTITTEVTSILKNDLLSLLDNSPYRRDMISLNVEFNEATLSSLNLLIQITLPGKYAAEYNNIRRLVQKFTIESCNKNKWIIPKNQLQITTHHV